MTSTITFTFSLKVKFKDCASLKTENKEQKSELKLVPCLYVNEEFGKNFVLSKGST